jgi:hypothetical protein
MAGVLDKVHDRDRLRGVLYGTLLRMAEHVCSLPY